MSPAVGAVGSSPIAAVGKGASTPLAKVCNARSCMVIWHFTIMRSVDQILPENAKQSEGSGNTCCSISWIRNSYQACVASGRAVLWRSPLITTANGWQMRTHPMCAISSLLVRSAYLKGVIYCNMAVACIADDCGGNPAAGVHHVCQRAPVLSHQVRVCDSRV